MYIHMQAAKSASPTPACRTLTVAERGKGETGRLGGCLGNVRAVQTSMVSSLP
jgi:hypothetical protein